MAQMLSNFEYVFKAILFTLIIGHCYCTSLPDYIEPCRRNDSQLDQCLVINGNKAIPHIVKGDPHFNVPNLMPLNVPHISILSSNGLQIEFADCEIYGLDMASLRSMHVDFDRRHVRMHVDVASLTLLANYAIDGRIMILAIQGKGPANITIAGGEYHYEFKYDLMKRKNGQQHVKFASNNLEYKSQRIYLHLGNLFNGDRRLADGMNMFLNDNWRQITDDFYPSLKEAISVIVTSIASGLFSKVPYEDLFRK